MDFIEFVWLFAAVVFAATWLQLLWSIDRYFARKADLRAERDKLWLDHEQWKFDQNKVWLDVGRRAMAALEARTLTQKPEA